MKMVALITWTFFLVCIIYPVEILGVESVCIAHSVAIGENATISCHFTEDLSIAPKRDVNVYLYKGDVSDSNLVLIYSWINGTPRIQLTQGYDCKSILTDHLEITVFNVTKEHEGKYRCIVAPSVNHQAHYCTLQIKGDLQSKFKVDDNAYAVTDTGYKDGYLSSSLSTFDESGGKNVAFIKAESRENIGHVLTITLSIMAIVFFAILAFLIIAYRKRWICKSERSTSDNDNVDTEQRGALTIPENNT